MRATLIVDHGERLLVPAEEQLVFSARGVGVLRSPSSPSNSWISRTSLPPRLCPCVHVVPIGGERSVRPVLFRNRSNDARVDNFVEQLPAPTDLLVAQLRLRLGAGIPVRERRRIEDPY